MMMLTDKNNYIYILCKSIHVRCVRKNNNKRYYIFFSIKYSYLIIINILIYRFDKGYVA